MRKIAIRFNMNVAALHRRRLHSLAPVRFPKLATSALGRYLPDSLKWSGCGNFWPEAGIAGNFTKLLLLSAVNESGTQLMILAVIKALSELAARGSTVLLMILGGCAVVMSPPESPLSPLPPVAGQACDVTVIRAYSLAGALLKATVAVDGQDVARLRNSEYSVIVLAPGRHSIIVRWQRPDILILAPTGLDMTNERVQERLLDFECNAGSKSALGVRFVASGLSEMAVDLRWITTDEPDYQLGGKTLVPMPRSSAM